MLSMSLARVLYRYVRSWRITYTCFCDMLYSKGLPIQLLSILCHKTSKPIHPITDIIDLTKRIAIQFTNKNK